MTYKFNNISYNKRPLTDDIAFGVVTNDFALAESQSPEFVQLTKPYKLGELAGQQNACPATQVEGLRELVDYLKKRFEGFRIRNVQLGGIAAINGTIDKIDEQTALFLAACGSFAVIAKEYKSNSDKALLSAGVLPLISQNPIPVGAFILIRNIKRDIFGEKLEAYSVHSDRLEEIQISLSAFTEKELENVLN